MDEQRLAGYEKACRIAEEAQVGVELRAAEMRWLLDGLVAEQERMRQLEAALERISDIAVNAGQTAIVETAKVSDIAFKGGKTNTVLEDALEKYTIQLHVRVAQLETALKEIKPYFKYRGVVVQFSPADYAAIREIINTVVGDGYEEEEKLDR